MQFQQLYYTSCRSGLSGYAGYQFNAVTPGVSPEVMNEVEALSSYEPPATLGHSPTPEQIAACPVNLCFVPGPRPIVANVAFTGTDYSGRFGNYFAHALVPADGTVWEGPPPIQLWRAPLWTQETAAHPDLPPLRGPLPTGPLDRGAVDDFLDRAAGRARLPALLAAAERAVLDQERSVVIYARDADEVARWIAALSFLLPPPLAARMSFATYQFRPSYSRHHVIGTVPGAEIALDERSFEAFYLFDFASGGASDVEAGPPAQLLAATGAAAAEPLWRTAARLAAGDELRLADWYPPVVAAALLDGGLGIGPADLDAVCAWLSEHAPRLGRDVVGRVGAAALDHEAASPAHLSRLADAAAASGVGELLALAEKRLVADQLAAAPTTARQVATLRSAAARDLAARRYTELLADADADAVVRLLGMAEAHGVSPDPLVLHDCGLRVVGPELLSTPTDTGLHEAVRQWSELRTGALEHLGRFPGDSRLFALFDAGFERAVPADELAGMPSLLQARLVARARRHPERRVDTALEVLSMRGPSGRIDNALLLALWPDGWSFDDARALLARLPERCAGDSVFVPWVERLPHERLTPGDADAYGALCDTLAELPLAAMLKTGLRDRLKAMTTIREAERRFAEAVRKRRDAESLAAGEALLAAYDAPVVEPARDYLRIRLAALLPTLPHDLRAALLVRAPDEVVRDHLAQVERGLDGDEAAAVAVAGAAFTTLCAAARRKDGKKVADGLQAVLLHRLPDWRKRRLNAVEREVRRRSVRMAEEFKRWRSRHCRPRRGWLAVWSKPH
ncbi:hypothetical protein Arub01_01230 [Actinomadura rubrobrunea]|uniref:Uncharacterized protein n=1 Tax=Actinomadura rubrobrunea TaxID=115335 RepID=A0A9W6USR4_9ACTN|nr:GTPase-associated protein 1-related protein [Actinomadura rubrobrunea]GLW61879.1 hypothetical protein Arub01_01230 [Actinomadura rubrobrunea]